MSHAMTTAGPRAQAELGEPTMRERSGGTRGRGGGTRPQIVIIGAGYAGYHCARGLERRLPAADIVIISADAAGP